MRIKVQKRRQKIVKDAMSSIFESKEVKLAQQNLSFSRKTIFVWIILCQDRAINVSQLCKDTICGIIKRVVLSLHKEGLKEFSEAGLSLLKLYEVGEAATKR